MITEDFRHTVIIVCFSGIGRTDMAVVIIRMISPCVFRIEIGFLIIPGLTGRIDDRIRNRSRILGNQIEARCEVCLISAVCSSFSCASVNRNGYGIAGKERIAGRINRVRCRTDIHILDRVFLGSVIKVLFIQFKGIDPRCFTLFKIDRISIAVHDILGDLNLIGPRIFLRIGHFDCEYIAVLHGYGKAFFTGKGLQACQRPVIVIFMFFNLQVFRVTECDIRNFRKESICRFKARLGRNAKGSCHIGKKCSGISLHRIGIFFAIQFIGKIHGKYDRIYREILCFKGYLIIGFGRCFLRSRIHNRRLQIIRHMDQHRAFICGFRHRQRFHCDSDICVRCDFLSSIEEPDIHRLYRDNFLIYCIRDRIDHIRFTDRSYIQFRSLREGIRLIEYCDFNIACLFPEG